MNIEHSTSNAQRRTGNYEPCERIRYSLLLAVFLLMGIPSQSHEPPLPARLPPTNRPARLENQTKNNKEAIIVEFFYSPGCDECRPVKEEVLPELISLFGDVIELRQYDIQEKENYIRLASLQEKLGIETSEDVSIYLNGRIHLGGLKAIRKDLVQAVIALSETEPDIELDRKPVREHVPARVEILPEEEQSGEDVLIRRFRSFDVWTIVLAGLIDGVNPCAFATIIFFITLLSVSGRKGQQLVLIGTCFCIAVFFTYLLLGIGAFRLLQSLSAYSLISEIIKWMMILLLVVLALVSFRDAWRFKVTADSKSVTLQLPDRIKSRIHTIMRKNLSIRGLVTGSLVTGFLVTLLESVCTGQVYAPTLVFLTQRPGLSKKAWALLLLYNLMFILPLVLVFFAAYKGTTNERLMAWSRQNVVWGKTLTGGFFLGLALIMLLI